MRFRTTLVLIVVLAAVALLIHYHGGDDEPEPQGPGPLFPGVVFPSVDRIEATMFLGRRAVLERDPGTTRWMVREPYEDEARVEIVQQILAALENNVRIELAPEAAAGDLKAKGLTPPRGSIAFRDARGIHRVDIGDRDPLGSDVFVTVSGSKALFRSGSNLLNLMEMNPEDLRDRRLFRIDPRLVDTVRLEGPDGTIMHAESSFSLWKITEPIKDEADSAGIQNLITRLSRFKVKSIFFPDATEADREAYGFGSGTFRLVLKAGSLQRAVIVAPRVLGPSGAVYCVREGDGSILTIDRGEFTRLVLDLDRFRSRSLVPQVREDVRSVAVTRAGEKHLLLKKDRGRFFSIGHPFEALADNIGDENISPVSTFLGALFSIPVDDFVAVDVEDLAPFGLDDPLWKVEVRWERGSTARKVDILFGGGGGGFVNALRSDKPGFVYSVKEEDIAFLDEDPLYLRDRRIFELGLLHVLKAEFTLGGRTFAIARSGPGKAFEDDPNQRFQEFLNELEKELVVRLEPGPSGEGDERFAEVWGSVRYFIDEPYKEAEEVLAEFGARTDGGWYGRISNLEQGVFVLAEDFMTRFTRLFEGL
jgi:hypothetical protein